MRPRLGIGRVALLGGLLLTAASPAAAMSIEPVPEKPGICDGLYAGKSITPNELAIVLDKHRRWVAMEPNGQQANLCGAALFQANLQEAGLFQANLQKADLAGANLQKAFLPGANLHSHSAPRRLR
jgi:Pentapeptide repeats (8 copies)